MDSKISVAGAQNKEVARLHRSLSHVGFGDGYCRIIAPLTSEISRLKKEMNAVVLAHSYQTPDIIFGIADFYGDSYQLSKKAQETEADLIIFCGVRFMAETAKILNPSKKVVIPSASADCSLADSITGEDVRVLKKKYPGRPVVVYVNTSAEVKAEADICCTSSNALKIINSLPDEEIIFLPDELMGKNLQKMTDKKLITWHGTCIVHDDFKAEKISAFRKKYPGVKVLAHSECAPSVVEESDFVGGTEGMVNYVKDTAAPSYMLVTECGLSDRMRVELPEKAFIGMCGLCPYMKQNNLPLILKALKDPGVDQIIEIPEEIRVKAEKSLNRMFEITRAVTV